MADEPADHTLRLLRNIDRKLDRLSLEFSDLRDTVHGMQADLGALRGTVAALRHDVGIFSTRWSDIEVRTRTLEQRDDPH